MRPELQQLLRRGRLGSSSLGENLLHRSHDLLGLEWFYHDAVCALAESLFARRGLCCQHDDGDGGKCLVLPQLCQDLEAASPRHHHVENHDVGSEAPSDLERLLAVVCLCETVRPDQADSDQLAK